MQPPAKIISKTRPTRGCLMLHPKQEQLFGPRGRNGSGGCDACPERFLPVSLAHVHWEPRVTVFGQSLTVRQMLKGIALG
jgi:hypothetical protein